MPATPRGIIWKVKQRAYASSTNQSFLELNHAFCAAQTHDTLIGWGDKSRHVHAIRYSNAAVDAGLVNINQNSHYEVGHMHMRAHISLIFCEVQSTKHVNDFLQHSIQCSMVAGKKKSGGNRSGGMGQDLGAAGAGAPDAAGSKGRVSAPSGGARRTRLLAGGARSRSRSKKVFLSSDSPRSDWSMLACAGWGVCRC